MDKATFTKHLASFAKSLGTTMTQARKLAEASLHQFAAHGDLSYAQQFFDAMSKNFMRRDAFIKWLVAHSPAKLEAGKWVKDKGPKANAFDVAKACEKPFWTYAPASEISTFSADDLMGAVVRLIHKYENENKMKPANEKATAALNRLKSKIAEVTTTNIPEPTSPPANEEKDAPPSAPTRLRRATSQEAAAAAPAEETYEQVSDAA